MALARWHGFTFSRGALVDIDRSVRNVLISEVVDDEGRLLIPRRRLFYDVAILAIGGVTNDFGVPGVQTHALSLDTVAQAQEIHARIIRACVTANYAPDSEKPAQFRIAIVGGGATGVELAAEMTATTRTLLSYGLDRLDPSHFIEIIVVNGDSRLLMQLPEALATDVAASLKKLSVSVHNGQVVVGIESDGIRTQAGEHISADLTIWAAGVRAPSLLAKLEGLETNRLGQIIVGPDLRSTKDSRVFALGDCAACPWLGHKGNVPARAQASQQQAVYLSAHMSALASGRSVPAFRYRDLGSLVSLGPQGSAIGTLMGYITGRNYRVRGLLAGMFYRWLYRRHRAALFGWTTALIESLGRWIGGVTRPRIKLH